MIVATLGLALFTDFYLAVIGLIAGDGEPGECDGRGATAAAAGDADCSGKPATSRQVDDL